MSTEQALCAEKLSPGFTFTLSLPMFKYNNTTNSQNMNTVISSIEAVISSSM